MRPFSFLCCTIVLIAAPCAAQDAAFFNVAPQDAPALVAALKDAGATTAAGANDAKDFTGPVVVWEASNTNDVTSERAQALGNYVRRGGALLLTLSEHTGAGPLRLAYMLPTTAWETQRENANRGRAEGPVNSGEADANFFGAAAPKSLALPFHFQLQPFHAVERGEQRYEKFSGRNIYINQNFAPGEPFWTRPLLNRDWQVRLRADDLARTPLLITGRYGAGRVAVFASSARGIEGSPAAKGLWTPLLKWLTAKDAAPAPAANLSMPAPEIATDPATRSLRVTLRNSTASALPIRVLARISTWERALIGDAEQATVIPANGQVAVTLPLPKSDATDYQALDYRDAFDVRIGVLSADGSALFNETRKAVDLRPAVGVAVATGNTRSGPYPFKAPGPDVAGFISRMGMETTDYARPPDQPFNAEVTLSNGTHNIAPLATPRDEVKPDNASAMALNDEAAFAEQNPGTDKIQAFGTWTGAGLQENILSFTFPTAVTVSGLTLIGSPTNYRNYLTHNPGAAIIEVDGKEVARADGLDQRFQDEAGAVRIAFAPTQGRVVRLRLPWVKDKIPGSQKGRSSIWLGEVRIDGSTEALPPAAQGTLSLVLRDSLTGVSAPIGSKTMTVEPGAVQKVSFAVTPPDTGKAPRFYTLEASFAGQQGRAPVMVIQPARPLQALADMKPATAPDLGFIVTRGFRSAIETGTGTDEIPPLQWATPDDLIWAYAHQMKQLGSESRTQANRLYLTESDMKHYSTPWRDFANGVNFYDYAAPLLVERMKRDPRWKDSAQAFLSHSDRWDSAPDVDALHGWQDFIAFDQYLRANNLPGLKGKTRLELSKEIHASHESRWQAWNLERYVGSVHTLRETFAKEGKQLGITAQGSPLVPAKFEQDLTATIRGQSDDPTWGMLDENPTLSVSRQMGIMAFNPGWAMSTPIQWGWDSAVLANPHWHNPVGTTEASRRTQYDRAWRGTIGWDGQYKSIHTYGYNQNGGYSFTMTPNDWQQFWRVEERHSLIGPDAPLGVGVIISTSRFADPDRTAWSGAGGWGKSAADDEIRTVGVAVRRLHEAGIGVPFAANVAALDKWTGDSPLVILDLSNFGADEIAILQKLKARGVRLAAFQGAGKLSATAAALFGVTPDALPDAGQVIAGANTVFIGGRTDDLNLLSAQALAPQLQKVLQPPVVYPEGTSGYGFFSQGKKFIVVEDWREQGRVVPLRVRAGATAKTARAADANDHTTLTVRRDGADWVIDLPMRPADAALVCLEES